MNFQDPGRGADLGRMGRSVGLVTIVISLVCSALLFASQWSGAQASWTVRQNCRTSPRNGSAPRR